ncbi:MAG TPA: hypothetical protein VGH24_12920 [Solirubrobacteraceae bacterium]|jgi:hypothetical protein
MTRRRALAVIAYLCAAAAALPAATASAATTIAVEPYASKLAAYGGVLAWSHWNATLAEFQLMARYGGSDHLLPVAPRSVPFDVDLGPDASGHTVAVYSRCGQDRSAWTLGPEFGSFAAPGQCVLYRYDFASGSETRIAGLPGGGSYYLPTIWKNQLAYVRIGPSGIPRLFVQQLRPSGRRPTRLIALPGGPASATGGPGPVSLSLRAGELAFAWQDVTRTRDGTTFDSTIYIDTATARGAVTQTAYDAEATPAPAPGFLGFATFTNRGLFYARSDDSPITPADDAFELLAPGGVAARAASAPHALFGATSNGGTNYALYGAYMGSSACAPPGCTLVATRGL